MELPLQTKKLRPKLARIERTAKAFPMVPRPMITTYPKMGCLFNIEHIGDVSQFEFVAASLPRQIAA
jgi:hypothetical protein